MALPKDRVATLSESTARELLELCKGFDGAKLDINPDDSHINIQLYTSLDDNAGPILLFNSEVMFHDGEIEETSYHAHQDLLDAVRAFDTSEMSQVFLNKKAELDQ